MTARFLLTRLFDLVLVLFGVSVLVFLMIRLIPGDAVAIMLGADTEVTPDRIQELERRLGLDLPLHQQYAQWIGGVLRGDLGTSIWTGRPVAQEIGAAIWPTLQLTFLSVLVGAGLAVPIGAFMAQARGQAAEVAVRIVAIAGLTIPSFWPGIVSILLVAWYLPGLSVLGYVPFSQDPLGNLQRMILPGIALALPMLANLSRLVRYAMLDAPSQDYIRTARAKGLSEGQALMRHAFRNALIPVLTILGLQFSFLIAGGIIIENVFFLPGLGRLVFQAITQRDLIVVESVVMLLVFAVILVTFLTDLAYAAADPRLRRRG